MPQRFSVCSYESDEELDTYGRLLSETFVAPPERSKTYFDQVGRQNIRLVRHGGEMVGGLVLLPKGQWFGGRAVPMTGIAAVAISPEHRAGGAATRLLHAVLQEMHAVGTPISTLYPATVALYRRVGYELAGLACDVTLPVRAVDLRDRALSMREATPDDDAAIRAVYCQYAQRTAGNLDRSEFNWIRAREYMREPARGYVVCRDDCIEGYMYVLNQTVEAGRWNLRVNDIAAITPAAVRRLLTFIADYRTIRDQVALRSGPADPILAHLAEAPYTITTRAPWMVRIVDLRQALAARGYPVSLNTEIHFNIRDDVLPGNAGRHVLRVHDGCGTVEPGGQGRIDLDIRGLAALYTGFMSPPDVVLAGLGAAPDADQGAVATVFAGPLPWMRDAF